MYISQTSQYDTSVFFQFAYLRTDWTAEDEKISQKKKGLIHFSMQEKQSNISSLILSSYLSMLLKKILYKFLIF